MEYQPERANTQYERDSYAHSLPFARDAELFYNPNITKVKVTIEGVQNQLYSHGLHAYEMWDEAKKPFAASHNSKRHPEVAMVAKDFEMADVSLKEFLTSKHPLWLDLRTIDDDQLHGSGRRVENAIEGMTIQISSLFVEHIPVHSHGCPAQYRRWQVRQRTLLIFSPRTSTQPSSAVRLDAERP